MRKSVKTWSLIKNIENGIIERKDGKLCKIIEIYPVNFSLKSKAEQESILYGYRNFFNTCNFDVQILVQSKKRDLDKHILEIEKSIEKEGNEKVVGLMKEYIDRIYKHPLMRAFRCGKTVLSILEKSVIKRLNAEGQFKGYCETLLAIKPEIIKQKALKVIENIEGFEVAEETVETGGGAMADTFYQSYAISFKPKDIKSVIKFMHNLDVPIIPKVKKDSVLIYVITINDADIDYVREVLIKIKDNDFLI